MNKPLPHTVAGTATKSPEWLALEAKALAALRGLTDDQAIKLATALHYHDLTGGAVPLTTQRQRRAAR